MNWQLTKLGLVFMMLSVLAVGGGTAVLPEMQHATVHWFNLTDKQFRDIYSLGQVAPGPNMLMVLVIGYRLAGTLGAIAVCVWPRTGCGFISRDRPGGSRCNAGWPRLR